MTGWLNFLISAICPIRESESWLVIGLPAAATARCRLAKQTLFVNTLDLISGLSDLRSVPHLGTNCTARSICELFPLAKCQIM
jgi:hypothetical protein